MTKLKFPSSIKGIVTASTTTEFHSPILPGRVEKPPGPAPWGGRTGCFADPDGHLWEVVFNDGMPMDAMGNVFLEPPGVW